MSYNKNNTPIVEHIITTYKLLLFRYIYIHCYALFRTEISNETRDGITTRRCFVLKPYVLVKTNFILKFGNMICLKLKYIAIEKFSEIKALESYKLL